MPTLPWRPNIDVIQDGEQVTASVVNRPTRQLADQTLHLKQQVTNLNPSSGRLMIVGARLTDAVSLGDVVYFDEFQDAYDPAIAEAVTDIASNEYIAGPRSYVVGVVVSKNGLIGDILQVGRTDWFGEFGISPATMVEDPINDPFVPSRYYLSAKIPGKITRHIVAPNIQIGYFTSTDCHINPLQKDLFETHKHYTFPLATRPSASQNFGSTGWNNFGDTGPTGRKWVDYFNNGVDTTAPDIVLCVRNNHSIDFDPGTIQRIELYRDATDQLAIELITDPNYDIPGSGTYPGAVTVVPWPEYGDWLAISGTPLEVAFIRNDATYTNPLSTDILTELVVPSNAFNRWKIFLPHDLYGWANANPFDVSTPTGVFYRYLTESDQGLSNVFPPIPTGSAVLDSNGTTLVSGADFKVTVSGIFWVFANFTIDYTYSPWPHDYSALTSWVPDPSQSRNVNIHFSRTGLNGSRSVVTSIKGINPVRVSDCPTGEDADSGDLQISVDLALLVKSDAPVTRDAAFVEVSGTEILLGDIVSELESGLGIRIDRLSTTRGKNVGKLRISRSDLKLEGEVSTIALRNAKQEVNDAYSYIDFLPPSQSSTGITAMIRIPTEGFTVTTGLFPDTLNGFIANNLKLCLFSSFIGNTAIANTASEQTAIFSVVYRILRKGVIGNTVTVAATHQWAPVFPAGYNATTVLGEVPADDALFQIPLNVVKPGDIISIQIDRVQTGTGGENDNYVGRAGLLGLRWILK